MSVEPLSCVERLVGSAPDAVIIWLHGLGADGNDFVPLVPELRLAPGLTVRFLFPHAPLRAVTVNMGLIMRAWYDVQSLELERDLDEKGLRESAARVEELIAEQKRRGLAAGRILLAGFSQGGAIAFHVALRQPEPLAGLLVLSAYLPLAGSLDREASEASRQGLPILQCHGVYDSLVPVELGQRSYRLASERGYRIEWRSYPVDHGVHPQEVLDAGRWISERLAP